MDSRTIRRAPIDVRFGKSDFYSEAWIRNSGSGLYFDIQVASSGDFVKVTAKGDFEWRCYGGASLA